MIEIVKLCCFVINKFKPHKTGFILDSVLDPRTQSFYSYLNIKPWNEIVRDGIKNRGLESGDDGIETRTWTIDDEPFTFYEKHFSMDNLRVEVRNTDAILNEPIGSHNISSVGDIKDELSTLADSSTVSKMKNYIPKKFNEMKAFKEKVKKKRNIIEPTDRVLRNHQYFLRSRAPRKRCKPGTRRCGEKCVYTARHKNYEKCPKGMTKCADQKCH